MGTAKRERQKANRAARIQAAEVAQKQAEKRKSFRNLGILVAFVAVAVVLVARFGRQDDPVATTTPGSGVTTTFSVPTPGGSALPGAGTTLPGGIITGDTPCPAADGSSPRTTTFAKAPPVCIDFAKIYSAKVSTTKGDFTITLDPNKAPKTVNNFVVLSRYHFYDGIIFHRVIPGFMAQGGDPLGTGTGGPGYQFEDELPKDADPYPEGAVAMANSGPNTQGSQFFVMVRSGGLAPNYSVFGYVTEGFNSTVQALMTGDSAGEPPTNPAVINSITIVESAPTGR